MPRDLGLLNGWLRQPQVRLWWGETAVDDSDLHDPRIARRMVEVDGRPFAYLQDHDVHGWPGHHFGCRLPGACGTDRFIGDPAMLGLGHGAAFIRARAQAVFAAGAPVVGTDPHPARARAIAACRKAGFEVVGPEEETRWGRVVRMEARPG